MGHKKLGKFLFSTFFVVQIIKLFLSFSRGGSPAKLWGVGVGGVVGWRGGTSQGGGGYKPFAFYVVWKQFW